MSGIRMLIWRSIAIPGISWVGPVIEFSLGKSRMLSTSLRLFSRIISRNREAYVLKIAALSISFATSIAIILFSLHEFGFDKFHKEAENIFRVIEKNNAEDFTGNRLSAKIPPDIVMELKHVSNDSLVASRVKIMHGVKVLANKKPESQRTIHAVDTNIDQIFTFQIEEGDVENFKKGSQPRAMISSQFANVHWGNEKVSDKTFELYTLNDTVHVKVCAVFTSLPANSHEQFDILIAFDIPFIKRLYFDPNETGIYGRTILGSPRDFDFSIEQKSYTLQPITDIYFGPRILGEAAKHGDRYSIIILLCITSLILFLAITTYINLTAITLPHRSKEMAVKKLAGTNREMLVLSFIRESFFLVTLAFLIGVLILIVAEHFILHSLGLRIVLMITEVHPPFLLLISSLTIMVVLAPVFMTIRFANASPNRLLSSDSITFPALKRHITFFQLGISICLIISSVVVQRQINYSLVKEPGQNHDQIVYLNSPAGITNAGVYALRDGWRKYNPNILDVMAVSQLPDRVSSKLDRISIYCMSIPVFGPSLIFK